MHAQPGHFDVDAGCASVFDDNVAVDGTGVEVPVKVAGTVVLDGTEEGTFQLPAVFRQREIVPDEPQRHRMHGNEPNLVPLALDVEVNDSLTALHVLDAQPAQLLAADAVIQP